MTLKMLQESRSQINIYYATRMGKSVPAISSSSKIYSLKLFFCFFLQSQVYIRVKAIMEIQKNKY